MLLFLIIFVLVIGIQVAVSVTHGSRTKAKLARLARQLEEGRVLEPSNPEVGRALDGLRVQGLLRGRRVQLWYAIQGRGKYRRDSLTLTMTRDLDATRFTAKKATLMRRLGRRLGLLDDIETGHEAIDDRFLLSGQHGAELARLFRSGALAQSLDRVFRHRGVCEVELETELTVRIDLNAAIGLRFPELGGLLDELGTVAKLTEPRRDAPGAPSLDLRVSPKRPAHETGGRR